MQSIPLYERANKSDHVPFNRDDMLELNESLATGATVDLGGVRGELIAIFFITRSLFVKTLNGDVEVLLQRPPCLQ